jgi:hypothetical protein
MAPRVLIFRLKAEATMIANEPTASHGTIGPASRSSPSQTCDQASSGLPRAGFSAT